MGLESIWNQQGNYLASTDKAFRARSTGCSCCSTELDSEEEVLKETIQSLSQVLLATRYFGWNLDELTIEANKLLIKNKGLNK